MDHDEVIGPLVRPLIADPREVDLERGTWIMPQDAAGGHTLHRHTGDLFLNPGVGPKIGV